ncbi:MAG: NTP transferase domain-containing protein [Candidatus Zixiibacteriota bacterium]|nr:MAG: NTP transferase domain-containing protein [candidate division Zixibacteria bacterium]
MKVVIPVAGEGTRLRPHTLNVPKPLLPIGGKKIIDYLVAPLLDLDLDEVVFVIGYKGDMIRQYVEKNYSFQSSFVRQDKLLGLGYALHVALKEVNRGPVMVLLGDTIVEGDLNRFAAAGKYTLGLSRVDDPTRFGVAEVADGSVVSVEEKPQRPRGDLALIGLYYFEETGLLKEKLRGLVDAGRTTCGEIQLTDALAAMLDDGAEFKPFEVDGWFDCGKKETMLSTNRHLLEKAATGREVDGSIILQPVFVPDSARIINSIIGPHVSIAGGTTIENSIVSDSIIGRNVRLKNVVIGESIIGDNVVLQGKKAILSVGDHDQVNDA